MTTVKERQSALTAFIVCLLCHPAHAEVDDDRVKAWITAAITGNDKPAFSLYDSTINGRQSYAVLDAAWKKLKRCRDAGRSQDLNLAAAEHYLFARKAANRSGDTNFRELPKFYETIKAFAVEHELETYLKSSDEPVSPVNAQVTQWGNTGVEHGLIDYEVREKKSPGPKSASKVTAILSGYAIYYYYKPPNASSCDVRV